MTAPGPERYCGRALKVAAFVALVGPLLGAAFISAIIMWRAIAEAALDPTSWSAVRDAGSVVMLVVGLLVRDGHVGKAFRTERCASREKSISHQHVTAHQTWPSTPTRTACDTRAPRG